MVGAASMTSSRAARIGLPVEHHRAWAAAEPGREDLAVVRQNLLGDPRAG